LFLKKTHNNSPSLIISTTVIIIPSLTKEMVTNVVA